MRALADRLRENSFVDTEKGGYALVFLLSLCTYAVLMSARALDDNTLTSWRWVFAHADSGLVLLAIAIGTAVAFGLARVSIAERYAVPFLFTFSFAAASLFWRQPEVIMDASRYVTQAKHLELYGVGYFFKEWGRAIAVWTDLPLVPFIYGLVLKLFGESRTYIQIATTLLFSGTVLITYQIGKSLWDKKTGFLGGLLLLAIPYLYTQVPLVLVDVPTMFFFALATYSFMRALERGGAGTIAFSSLAILLAFFSKYSTWVMLSILVAVFFAYRKRTRDSGLGTESIRPQQRALIYRSAAVLVPSAVIAGIAIAANLDVVSGQLELLATYQRSGLRRWGESFYSTFLFQVHPFLTVAAAYATYVAFKKRDWRYLIIGWPVLLTLALQIERIRYIIMVFPMLALMASYGLQQVKNVNLRNSIAYCAVLSSLAIAHFAYLPFMQSISAVNVQDAGRYLNDSGVERVEVFTVPPRDFPDINLAVAVPTLDLFTTPKITYQQSRLSPSMEEIRESSMRFTWDYRNPAYYEADKGDRSGKAAAVVIAASPDEPLPQDIAQRLEGYKAARVFNASTGYFRYQTVVTVYQPDMRL